jgi:hypothetical protein
MNEIAIGKASAELEVVSPAPEAGQVEAGPDTTLQDAAPADDSICHGGKNPEPAPEPGPPDHPLGSLRQRILDALADGGPLTVGRILQELPDVSRNTMEGGLRRALAAGEIQRGVLAFGG